MEYRNLPRGSENEKFSVLGLGMGGIGKAPADEIAVYFSSKEDK